MLLHSELTTFKNASKKMEQRKMLILNEIIIIIFIIFTVT